MHSPVRAKAFSEGFRRNEIDDVSGVFQLFGVMPAGGQDESQSLAVIRQCGKVPMGLDDNDANSIGISFDGFESRSKGRMFPRRQKLVRQDPDRDWPIVRPGGSG